MLDTYIIGNVDLTLNIPTKRHGKDEERQVSGRDITKFNTLARYNKKKEKLTFNFQESEKTSLLICDIPIFTVKRNVTVNKKNSNVAIVYRETEFLLENFHLSFYKRIHCDNFTPRMQRSFLTNSPSFFSPDFPNTG